MSQFNISQSNASSILTLAGCTLVPSSLLQIAHCMDEPLCDIIESNEDLRARLDF